MGKLIAASGEIPRENLFLYTIAADTPFFDQPWLGQWFMERLLAHFGHAGPQILRNIIAVLTWAGLLGVALQRARDPRVVGGLGLLAVAAGAPVFAVRTQIFAFLPYIGLLAVIFGVADGRLRRRWLLALAPLTALWANLHGTFILVPIMVGLCGGALVVERWLEARKVDLGLALGWGGAAVFAALAALLNPRGVGIYAYVYQLTVVSPMSQTVSEWQPPDITTAYGALVVAVLLGCLVLLAWQRRTVRLYEVVLFAATAYLAVGSIRHMFWWSAVMLMVTPRPLARALNLGQWWRSTTTRPQGFLHLGAAIVLLGSLVLSQPGLWGHQIGVEVLSGTARRTGPGKGLLDQDSPTRIIQGLQQDGYPGRIFHSQSVGGYLAYALGTPTPRQVAFVDQRMEMIPQPVWDTYFELSEAEDGWRALLQSYDIRTLLLAPAEQDALIRAVQEDPEWVLVAVDEGHLLFFRADQSAHLTRWRSRPSET